MRFQPFGPAIRLFPAAKKAAANPACVFANPVSAHTPVRADMAAEEQAHARWGSMWDAGIEPGQAFDAKVPGPCLLNEIKSGRVPEGRALVPGCGRGYDVFALASDKRHVLGVDLAEKAVEAARALNDACEAPENASFSVGNFFELPVPPAVLDGGGAAIPALSAGYDFIYDYTFLCALHPSVREGWAAKMAKLVKPGGVLLTLVFPICEKEGGPPFAMSLELVEALLMRGEQAGQWEKLELGVLPPELCHRGRDGSTASGEQFGSSAKSLITPETAPKGAVYSGIGRWRRV